MMRRTKVVVVGAGPGGLSASMLLASRGIDVQVFEAQPQVGGRNASFTMGEYRFDRGPTFLNMPHLIQDVFREAGRKLEDYVTLAALDPMYALRFEDVELTATTNRERMREQIERLFPGNGEGYDRFMQQEAAKLEALSPLLQSKHDSLLDYMRPQFLRALPKLTVTKSLYDCLSDYFTDERLRLAFTFQAKYLGMSPWECPGAFTILPYIEHAYGVFHPIGGVNRISEAMADVAREHGGSIETGAPVRRIVTRNGKAIGVELENGDRVDADHVVIGADFGFAASRLLDEGASLRWSPSRLSRKAFSCSTFMLYLGLSKRYEMPHHQILFARNYRTNVDEITKRGVLSEDPSIYVQNGVVTDPTLAPDGHSALYILAPVPNNSFGINWPAVKESFRERVLQKVKSLPGLGDLDRHIRCEQMFTPQDWETSLNVYRGATFNLGHQLTQMMYFRPHNRFGEIEGCWLVGGGTHPGSGLPTIIESGRITASMLSAQVEAEQRRWTFRLGTNRRKADSK